MLESRKKRTRAQIESVFDMLQELDSHLTEMHDAIDGMSTSDFCNESLKLICNIEEQLVLIREDVYQAYDAEVENLSGKYYEYFKKEYGLTE
jgi:hypothetical protein